MKEKIAILLCLALLGAAPSAPAQAAPAYTASDAGTPAGIFLFDPASGTVTGLTDEGAAPTRLVIPAEIGGTAVTGIGSRAFFGCASLVSVSIPDSVRDIGDGAFFGCGGLTALTIPAGVTQISLRAFGNCGALTKIDADPANTSYVSRNGVLFTADMKTLTAYPGGRAGACTIPEGVEAIGEGAFLGCEGLTGISLPEGLVKIGWGAFSECAKLADLPIPAGVTEICGCAFEKCPALTEVSIPGTVKTIGFAAFRDCDSLTKLVIEAGVAKIEHEVFEYCDALSKVCYTGTEEQWNAIDMDFNSFPDRALIHFNCGRDGFVPPEQGAAAGDVTGDGLADNMDAALILRYDADLVGETARLLEKGDVTGDGLVDNMDAALILRYDARLIDRLPAAVTAQKRRLNLQPRQTTSAA